MSKKITVFKSKMYFRTCYFMTKLEILLNIKVCISEESYMGEHICVFLSKDFQFIVSYNSLSNDLLRACSYYCWDSEEPT